jgi:signal recognition particle GTPase
MSDWFTESYEKLIKEIADSGDIDEDDVRHVYSYLSNIGLIDYDVEKEIYWDLYGPVEEDTDEEESEE